ncbi:hypothetical protein [Desulfobacter postgatei]|uniref:hypothetical protein n=1 Tax=Desulfobacter postgatei TaxID=2293 RepID=UPI002FDAAD0D
MELESLEKNSLVILKSDDLRELLEKAAAKQPAQVPTPSPDFMTITQAEAIHLWKTTRQRLARLRRLGLLEALELNGRIFYRPSAYADAMQSLNRHKKPLV